jgi:hypothetical protein
MINLATKKGKHSFGRVLNHDFLIGFHFNSKLKTITDNLIRQKKQPPDKIIVYESPTFCSDVIDVSFPDAYV